MINAKSGSKPSYLTIGILAVFTLTTLLSAAPANAVLNPPGMMPVNPASGSQTCEVTLKGGELVLAHEYRAVGYVTKTVVNQFSHTTPILFTEVYFNGLGKALAKEKLFDVVDEKGIFHEKISKIEKLQINDLINNDVQLQGRLAERIWKFIESKYALSESDLTPEKVLELTHQAGYTKSSEFTKTRQALLNSLSRRSQVVEFIRLSLKFGVTLAIDGNRRKALIYSVTGGTVIGALAAAATWITAQLGTTDPGLFPLYVGAGSAALSGVPIYFYSFSKKDNPFLRIYRHWLNKNNQKILEEEGLISETDGENNLFIDGAYSASIEKLQSQVEVSDIKMLQPHLPAAADAAELRNALFKFQVKLPEYMAMTNSFMDAVITGWRAKTVSMGEPIFALTKLFEIGEGVSEIPLSADEGLLLYRKYLEEVFPKVSETKAEFDALVAKYSEYISYLENYLDVNRATLDVAQQVSINEMLMQLAQGRQTVETFALVSQTHLTQLTDENKLLISTLQALATARSSKRLAPEQRTSIFGLMKIVEQAQSESNERNGNETKNAK